MATVVSPLNPPAGLPYQPMRISVERYHELIDQGFFGESNRYELLEGVVVEKHPPPTKNPLVPYQPMRITVARYHELIDQGFFAENNRFELLEGVIVEKMTKHPPHSYATKKCYALLTKMVAAVWHVISQEPISLVQSEPEPDVAIIKGGVDDFKERHPTLGEIPLVIEISDSSLTTDRYKAGVYAAAGIPVYWIVDLQGRVVEVYSSPKLVGDVWGYSERKLFTESEDIPVTVEDQIIGKLRVNELLL